VTRDICFASTSCKRRVRTLKEEQQHVWAGKVSLCRITEIVVGHLMFVKFPGWWPSDTWLALLQLTRTPGQCCSPSPTATTCPTPGLFRKSRRRLSSPIRPSDCGADLQSRSMSGEQCPPQFTVLWVMKHFHYVSFFQLSSYQTDSTFIRVKFRLFSVLILQIEVGTFQRYSTLTCVQNKTEKEDVNRWRLVDYFFWHGPSCHVFSKHPIMIQYTKNSIKHAFLFCS